MPTSSHFIAKVVIVSLIMIKHVLEYIMLFLTAIHHGMNLQCIYTKLKDNNTNSIKISKISTDKLDLAARRPLYSVLDNDKLRNISKIQIKDWRYYVDQLLQKDDYIR